MITNKLVFKKHLEEGEEILYAVHKHWMKMVKPTVEIAFFGIFLPWALFFMGFNTTNFLLIVLVWTLMAFARFVYVFIDWYSDAWLITNMSVITVEWNGFFSNTSSRSSFEDVEGATYVIKGFWPTIFRYGNMTLRLMSGSNFHLNGAASPKKAELKLAHFQNQYMSARSFQDSSNLKTLLSDLVSTHARSKIK